MVRYIRRRYVYPRQRTGSGKRLAESVLGYGKTKFRQTIQGATERIRRSTERIERERRIRDELTKRSAEQAMERHEIGETRKGLREERRRGTPFSFRGIRKVPKSPQIPYQRGSAEDIELRIRREERKRRGGTYSPPQKSYIKKPEITSQTRGRIENIIRRSGKEPDTVDIQAHYDRSLTSKENINQMQKQSNPTMRESRGYY